MRINENLTSSERDYIAFAIKKLSDALIVDSKHVSVFHVNRAIDYCHNCLGSFLFAPDLTLEESEWSRTLHSYLRKCDDHLSIILYKLIDSNKVNRVWYSFVKDLVSNDFITTAFYNLEKLENLSFEEFLMKYALKLWFENGVSEAMKFVREEIQKIGRHP